MWSEHLPANVAAGKVSRCGRSELRYRRVALAVGSMLACCAAQAQTAGTQNTQAADAQSNANDLQEITVTAQRRSESLERVPVVVSALGADELVEQQIDSESDLQTAVSGLLVRAGRSSDVLNYSIRGETVDPISDMRPGVLPYVDEIQVGGSGGSTALYDLQSIQVLKGPQGTLFGRNSPGGAVIITTSQPTNEFGGYADVRFGNFDTRYFEGAVNLPLVTDKVLFRIAAIDSERDGIQTNQLNGQDFGVIDRKGARATLVVNFTDQLKNQTVVDYLHSGGSPVSGVLYSLDPKGAIPTIALTNAATMDATISAMAGVPGIGNGASAAYFAAHPTYPKGGARAVPRDSGGLGTLQARRGFHYPVSRDQRHRLEYQYVSDQ